MACFSAARLSIKKLQRTGEWEVPEEADAKQPAYSLFMLLRRQFFSPESTAHKARFLNRSWQTRNARLSGRRFRSRKWEAIPCINARHILC